MNDQAMDGQTAAELDRAGLLHVDDGVRISRFAVFVPADTYGVRRPITIRSGAVVGAFAIVHGGTDIGSQAQVQDHAVVGRPELGESAGRTRCGVGGPTTIGAGAVLRGGSVVYAGVCVGANSEVGHGTLLHGGTHIGAGTRLGHQMTVDRASRIGRNVRCSAGSHITSATHIADGVFLGAGIRTLTGNGLVWPKPDGPATLGAPRFDTGAKVGCGCVVLPGVTIGEHSLVGAGSLVTRDVPARSVAFGHPARVHGEVP